MCMVYGVEGTDHFERDTGLQRESTWVALGTVSHSRSGGRENSCRRFEQVFAATGSSACPTRQTWSQIQTGADSSGHYRFVCACRRRWSVYWTASMLVRTACQRCGQTSCASRRTGCRLLSHLRRRQRGTVAEDHAAEMLADRHDNLNTTTQKVLDLPFPQGDCTLGGADSAAAVSKSCLLCCR